MSEIVQCKIYNRFLISKEFNDAIEQEILSKNINNVGNVIAHQHTVFFNFTALYFLNNFNFKNSIFCSVYYEMIL